MAQRGNRIALRRGAHTVPTGIAIRFLGLFGRPVAAALPVLAIATVAHNIYQAVRKAVRAAA